MGNITQKEITELLSIIPLNFPILDIFHLTNDCQGLCMALDSLCKSQGYNYDLCISDESYLQEIEETTDLTVKKFNFKKSRYNIQSRTYDFVFIMIDLESIEDPTLFYKKLYPISKNASKVLFIVEKDVDLRKLEDVLIVHNYVATNPIEDTFENYQILGAQKMHGWGN